MWLTVWYCQYEGITPICWRLFSFLSALTPVDSTVGCRNRSNAEFILIWRFFWAGCSPFILPLSVSSIFDLTSESDPLSSVYFRPVWLQSHNSLDWNCSCSTIHRQETKMSEDCLYIFCSCVSKSENMAGWIFFSCISNSVKNIFQDKIKANSFKWFFL